jgi:ATP-dependent DNA helicase RecQ
MSTIEESLFAALKDLRTRIAKEAGVPSYVIFSDATLRDMCRKQPATRSEFLLVSGVGAVKADKYADVFIETIIKAMPENKS